MSTKWPKLSSLIYLLQFLLTDIMEGWPSGYGACHHVDPSILEQVRDSPGDAILSITIRYRANSKGSVLSEIRTHDLTVSSSRAC